MVEENKCILNGNVQLIALVGESDHAYIYEGVVSNSGQPCIVKQYKEDISTPQINEELKIYTDDNKIESLPKLLFPVSKEPDGYFAVFSMRSGQFLHQIIESTSSLDTVEASNILIQMFQAIRYLAQKRIALDKISPKTITYSGKEPETILMDISSHFSIKNDVNEAIAKEMQAVKAFIEEVIPWVCDVGQIDDIWLKSEESEIVSFYRMLNTDPMGALKHPLISGKVRPITDKLASYSEGFDMSMYM